MPKSVADRFLAHVASKADLVQEVRSAKNKAKKEGGKVIFHRLIKDVKPTYRFYRAHALLIKQLQQVIDGKCKRLIVALPPRLGKLLAHDTPVLTPSGWRTHGDLRPGDYVYHPDGHPVKVLAVSAEATADHCLSFSNGDMIWCHGNHEWEVFLDGLSEPCVMEARALRHLLNRQSPAGGNDGTRDIHVRRVVSPLEGCRPVPLQSSLATAGPVRLVAAELPVSGARPGRCIQVDSPDGLYLAGRNLTPTHNSELSSRLLPAAYLLANPTKTVAICSYSAELAEGFSREAREYYKAAGGELDASNTSVSNWSTSAGGGCWATGIGGSVVGRSADLIIGDDTIKGREEADSPRAMEKLWSFYQGSLYTRLEPGDSAIVIVATRWGENDLTGRLLELEKSSPEGKRENWTIIDLPAISEDQSDRPVFPVNCHVIPDWREEPGLALCPQRYDEEDLERIKQVVGPREWAAQYQQRPAPIGGNLFNPDWWQYYESIDRLPVMDRKILSVDCSFTDGSKSDYVVGTVIGQSGNCYYLLDMCRERMNVVSTIAMMLRLSNQHSVDGTIIELAANGHAISQMLSKRVPGLVGFKPGGRSKEARATAIVPTVEAGNVYLPRYAPWIDIFINEFSLFPAAKNDDIVDSVSQCIIYLNERSVGQLTTVQWGRSAALPSVLTGIKV